MKKNKQKNQHEGRNIHKLTGLNYIMIENLRKSDDLSNVPGKYQKKLLNLIFYVTNSIP